MAINKMTTGNSIDPAATSSSPRTPVGSPQIRGDSAPNEELYLRLFLSAFTGYCAGGVGNPGELAAIAARAAAEKGYHKMATGEKMAAEGEE